MTKPPKGPRDPNQPAKFVIDAATGEIPTEVDTPKTAPCDLCKAQVKKGRYADPHEKLRLIERGKPYGHMFGGGIDSYYVCEACGAKMFHSTDKADFGWQL